LRWLAPLKAVASDTSPDGDARDEKS
jgi:hypothetical protein